MNSQTSRANCPQYVLMVLMFFNMVRDEEPFKQVVKEERRNDGNHQISDRQVCQARNPQTFGKDIKKCCTQETPSGESKDVVELVPESQDDTPA